MIQQGFDSWSTIPWANMDTDSTFTVAYDSSSPNIVTYKGEFGAQNGTWEPVYPNKFRIKINSYSVENLSDNQIRAVAAHEMGHTFGLGDIDNANWPEPSIMNYKRPSWVYQRQFPDMVGAWEEYYINH